MTSNLPFRCLLVLTTATWLLPAQATERAGSTAAPVAPADAAARPRAGTTVGVVDVDVIYENYPRALRARQQLDELKNQYRRELANLQQVNEQLAEMIKAMREGTPEQRAARLDHQAGRARHDKKQELYEDILSMEGARNYAASMDEIAVAIAKVARDRGVQVVLQTEQPVVVPEGIDPKSEKAVRLRMSVIERRKVWFADESVDLTAAVIKYLQVATPEMLGVKPDKPAGEPAPAAKDPAKEAGNEPPKDPARQDGVAPKVGPGGSKT
jgi:Skp family chaperone for outer membrane proteins